jgi:hypothetical protein
MHVRVRVCGVTEGAWMEKVWGFEGREEPSLKRVVTIMKTNDPRVSGDGVENFILCRDFTGILPRPWSPPC